MFYNASRPVTRGSRGADLTALTLFAREDSRALAGADKRSTRANHLDRPTVYRRVARPGRPTQGIAAVVKLR